MITKEKFNAYRKVQYSGRTNMIMIDTVMKLSRLTKEECFEIIKKYPELQQKYEEYERSD